MKPEEQSVLQWMQMLAVLRGIFREGHILLEMSGRFQAVSVQLIPVPDQEQESIGPERTEAGAHKPSLMISLDAELVQPRADDRHAIGCTLEMWRAPEGWKAEGELGWTGYESGWEHFYQVQLAEEDLGRFMQKLPAFAQELMARYRAFTVSMA